MDILAIGKLAICDEGRVSVIGGW